FCILAFYVLILMLLRSHPVFPLFPYTTLFRSPYSIAEAIHLTLILLISASLAAMSAPPAARPKTDEDDEERRAPASAIVVTGQRDRKSTRLNSSHVSTSYAVSCLKKKTQHRPS